MKNIADEWKNKQGIDFLINVGIKKDDKIFDCCCGEGNFSIPAAKIVKQNGMIYALDMNRQKLDDLLKKSITEDLKNIKLIM